MKTTESMIFLKAQTQTQRYWRSGSVVSTIMIVSTWAQIEHFCASIRTSGMKQMQS